MPILKLDNLKKNMFARLERAREKLLTLHTRPLYAKALGTWSDGLIKQPKFAIVIQGPVVKENDFTLETIKLYKKHFEHSNIILSTWNDEAPRYLEKIEQEEIEIILNKKPELPGISNINFQITSALSGVKRAKELGAEYVLKTRTDQRMYAPNILEFFCNLAHRFPPTPGSNQKQRIIGVSLNTYKYRPYGLSDMNIFGHIEDMAVYWGPELDTRIFKGTSKTTGDWAKMRLCEVYLSTKFLEKIGRELKWTLADSWQVFADHFCVVDAQSLDLYWLKYERYKEYRHLNYQAITNERELSFAEWFNLYAGLANKSHVPEESLQLPFNCPLTPPK